MPSPQSIIFGFLASLTFVVNLWLCTVLIRARRTMLRKTAYNVLILNLAIADVLQGLLLFITPGYVFAPTIYPLMAGYGGEFFCRTVFSTYFLFVCGKASNASVMCLSIERWYAVVKPTEYKSKFGRRRLYTYIVLIWLSAAITEIFELFIATLVDGSCQWIIPFYGEKAEKSFIVFHVAVTFYIPSFVTWMSFIHIWIRMSRNPLQPRAERTEVKKSVVRMCALAALCLTVSWFPTETFWVLKKFQVVILTYDFYLAFNLLAFFSSCANPFIYCLTNKRYRQEVLASARRSCCCPHRLQAHVSPFPSTQNSNEDKIMYTLRLQAYNREAAASHNSI